MHTAGLVLDLYDDPTYLRDLYSCVEDIPAQVKTASVLTPSQLDQLPDAAFAVVLLNGGDKLRKYACVDEGNTLLNVQYFLGHGHKLPEEAQKVAAAGLVAACHDFGVEYPEKLEKVAIGLTTLLVAPSVVKGTGAQLRSNMDAIKAGGGRIVTPQQQQLLGNMMKGAEVDGTGLAPRQEPGDLREAVARGKPGTSLTSVSKSAAVGHLVPGHASEQDAVLEQGTPTPGCQYASAPQALSVKHDPVIDVSTMKPPVKVTEKVAEFYAYDGRYPLDSYAQVKLASAYFDEHSVSMPPSMRREFAVNMVKRASAMGIAFSKEAANYGASEFSTEEQMLVGLDSRVQFISEKQAGVLREIFDKRDELGPDKCCEVLCEFDKEAGLTRYYDTAVMNPYEAVFGEKIASESWVSGNDYITKKALEDYGITGFSSLCTDYGEEFAEEFKKDAWGIFNSLPVDQQKILARRAGDNSATGMHDVH